MALVNSCFERGLNLYELKKNDFSYVCARTEYANLIINESDLRKCFKCIGKIINFDFYNTCKRQRHWFKYVIVKSVSNTETWYNLKKILKSTKHKDSFFCVEKVTRELSFKHTLNHYCSKFCFKYTTSKTSNIDWIFIL